MTTGTHQAPSGWGGLIAARRRRAHLTQAQLAAQLGVSASSVALWETGRSVPRGRKLTALARTLALTPDELGGAILTEDGRADQG